MNMQNSIDEARQQLAQLDREWEDLSDNGDCESLTWQKDHLHAQIRLWEFLQDRAGKESHLCVYPKIQNDDLKCDALMITAGGIYLYHLLPFDASTIQIQWPNILASGRYDHSTCEIGRSMRLMSDIIIRFGLTSVAIYEVYITPPSFDQRYTFDGVLILNFQQLSELFTNLVFRENGLYEQQEVLRNYLTQQRGADHPLSAWDVSNAGQTTSSYEDDALLTVEDNTLKAEKEAVIAEVYSASELAAPAEEEPRPIIPVSENKIPPRRSKENKKQQGWIAKLFSKK